ncbi:glycosyltransferase [Arcicella aquatica]|uniref:Glycosyltransferase n=1 Tax=Arcicella aquatica TaxID=217141 RepID=A0ABU5QJN4_9BACT|nr:glycosyltransferase [Arcicella aquatica]MEA5257281.1 glycosyltransferase [Arcicella aquatica]
MSLETPQNPVSCISVVMCTYNGINFIEEQLDCIINQTYPLKEILIFDDASTDGTWDKLQELKVKYPILSIQQNEKNLGFNVNFQQALMAANGDIIAIADQDDIWALNKIQRLMEAWTEDTPIIHCDSIRFNGEVPKNPQPTPNYLRFSGNDPRKLFFYNTVSGHAMLVKKSFLKEVIPFPIAEGFFYDWWMTVVAACNGGVSYLNEILVFQRVHGKNASIDFSTNGNQSFIKHRKDAFNHMSQFLKYNKIPAEQLKFTSRLNKLFEKKSDNIIYKLFFMMLIWKNRNLLFSCMVRKPSLLPYTKYSIQWAIK